MGLLRDTFREFSEDHCMQMAAALAFYTMLSLAPLALLVVTAASAVMGPSARERFIHEAEQMVGAQGADELDELLSRGEEEQTFELASRSSWTERITQIASIALLIFSATGLMAQLQLSLNQVWDVEPDPKQGGVKNFLIKRALSLAMIAGIALLLLISMLLTTTLGVAGRWITEWLGISLGVQYLISEGTTFVLITILFAVIFKVLPDAQVPWKVTWIGAVMTAVLFTLGKFLIGLYLGNKDMSSSYGQAGSLVLLLVWIYYSSMIFFFGAELTQVFARRQGWKIAPAEGAARVVVHKDHASE
jgi:membrane protein